MKFHLHFSILFCMMLLCLGQVATPASAKSTSITVVSDTTDTVQVVEDDSTLMVANLDKVNPRLPNWWRFFLGEGGFWDAVNGLFMGGFTVIGLLVIFGFLIFPILAIVLIIYLIMRGSKQKEKLHYYADSTQPMPEGGSVNMDKENAKLEKEKDKLIVHIAVASGLSVFFLVYEYEFFLLMTFIYLCIQAAKFYNIYRAQKRNENNF